MPHRNRLTVPDRMAARMAAIAQHQAPTAYVSVEIGGTRPVRTPIFRPAIVTLAFGEKFPVVIKDLGPGGARIEYFQTRKLPDELHIKESRSKLNTRAVVTWRGPQSCGLRFVGD